MKREFLRGSVSTAALLVYLSLSAPVSAQSASTVEWIGPAGPIASDYNDGSQWSSGVAPTAGDDVVIGNGGSPSLSSGLGAAASLTLDANSEFHIGLTGVPATMLIGGATTIQGGARFGVLGGVAIGGAMTVDGGQAVADGGEINSLTTRIGGSSGLASMALAVNGGLFRAGSVTIFGGGPAPATLKAAVNGTVETAGITATGPAASVVAVGVGSILRDSETVTVNDGAYLGALGNGHMDLSRVNIVNGGFSVDQSTANVDKLNLASGMASADIIGGSELNTNGTNLNGGASMNVSGSTWNDYGLTKASNGSELNLRNSQVNLSDLQLGPGARADVDASSSLSLTMGATGQAGEYSYIDGSELYMTGRFVTDGYGLDDAGRAIGFVVGTKGIGSRVVYSGGAQVDHRSGVVLGEQAGSTGEMFATGAGTRVDAMSLEVGRGGNGTLRIEDGARVNASNNTRIGGSGNGRGELAISGEGSKLTTAMLTSTGNGNVTIGAGSEIVSGRAGNSFFPGTDIGGRIYMSATDSHATKNSVTVDGKFTLQGAGTSAQFGNGGQVDILVRDRGVMTAEGRILLGGASKSFSGEVFPGSANLGIAAGGTVASKGFIAGRDAGSLGNVAVRGEGSLFDVRGGFNSFGIDGFSTVQVAENGTIKADVLNFGGIVDPSDKSGKRKGTGSGQLVVGALAGQAPIAPGVVDAKSINTGAGGEVLFNHNSSDYAFAPQITGVGSARFLGGSTRFVGDHTFTGKTTIGSGATVHTDHRLASSRVDVLAGGALTGAATIDGILANAGVVAPGAGLPKGQYATLTAGTYVSNGGLLPVRTFLDKTGSPSDKLVANELVTDSGATGVVVTNTDGLGAADAKIEVIKVTGGASKSAKDAFELVGRAAAGAYEYDLVRAANGSWNLQTDPDAPIRAEIPIFASVPDLVRNFDMAVLGTSEARRGGLPEFVGLTENNQIGWGRVFGSVGSKKGDLLNGYGPSFDYQIKGMQAGYDVFRNEVGSNGLGTGGFYFAAGSASAEVKQATSRLVAGDMDLTAYTVGGYYRLGFLGGAWIEFAAQGTRYDAETKSVLGQSSGTDGYGILGSIEGGMPFHLGDNWMLEPQAQLIVQKVSLGDVTDSYGHARIDDQTIATARLGAKVTRSFLFDNGMRLGVWGRVSVYQTAGDFGSVRITDLKGSNLVEYKAGQNGTAGSIEAGAALSFAHLPVAAFATVSYDAGVGNGAKGDHGFGGRVGLQVKW